MNLAHRHIDEKTHEERRQSLCDHNRQVGRYAAQALESVGFSSLGMLAGILHDGKGTEKYQKYLKDAVDGKEVRRGSVNHTFAGCIYILERYHGDTAPDKTALTAEIIAYAIGAHHGLFDCIDFDGKNGFLHRLDADRDQIEYAQAKHSFEHEISDPKEIESLFYRAVDEVDTYYEKLHRHLSDLSVKTASGNTVSALIRHGYPMAVTAMLVRMVTSAIMYGDRRDTAEFMAGKTFGDTHGLWDTDLIFLENKIAKFDHESPINHVRQRISDQCKAFADMEPGIYRLNVPTGGGKTLAVLRYALAHAAKYDKQRIIFVAPLLTIIDQNAKSIRDYLPSHETILEHHSDVIMDGKSKDEADLYDMMKSRWSAPIIITTMVQLLEILFSAKTQSVTRMRALCDSVIVFDEVQSLPQKTLQIFNIAMNFLAGFCGATIVLSSATQPALDGLDFPINVNREEMVSLTESELTVFKRCRIENRVSPYGSTIEDIAAFCLDRAWDDRSVLVICNTKREAKRLFNKIYDIRKNTGREMDVFHLSASMCKAHRKAVLDTVMKSLDEIQEGFARTTGAGNNRRLILVSTQLVEAGVDFSFHTVIRVLAGDDNIVQSAGRCNRSNEYGNGNFFIVRLNGEKLRGLPDIQSAQEAMTETLYCDTGMPVDSQEFVRDYYLNLYAAAHGTRITEYPIEDGTHTLTKLLSGNLAPIAIGPESGRYKLLQPFKKIGSEFRVFEDDTEDVLVPYGKGKEIISSLRDCQPYEYNRINQLIKDAAEYSVKIYEWQKKKLEENGMLNHMLEDHVMAIEEKAYDELFGLDDEAKYSIDDFAK